MLQKYNKWKVLQVFFDDPSPEGDGFQLREISRKAGIAPPSVKNYLGELLKEGLITESKHRVQNYPTYRANRESLQFRLFKKVNTLVLLEESGLLEYLQDSCMPDTMVLFGSASRGEDLISSDIDLYLQCKKRNLELEDYEKIVKRSINLIFEEKFDKLSPELRNNIINGIILRGYLKGY